MVGGRVIKRNLLSPDRKRGPGGAPGLEMPRAAGERSKSSQPERGSHAKRNGTTGVSQLSNRRRALIIFNPSAGARRRQRLAPMLKAMEELGVEPILLETERPGDAERFAREADPASLDLVAVAGGDGTVNEVINGLVDKPLPLAVLPVGTANVLAIELGIRQEPNEVARMVAFGEPRPIALGRVNRERRFVLMVGAGFDARVVSEVSLALKRRFGKLAYLAAFLHQMFAFRFRTYEVEIDGVVRQAGSVVVTNARHYAGDHVIAPHADLASPSLDVCLFGKAGRLAVAGYGLALVLGRLPALESFSCPERL